jgi:hypothetical protein
MGAKNFYNQRFTTSGKYYIKIGEKVHYFVNGRT